MQKLNKFRGCLLGGAIGDALGYPVEFMKLQDIKTVYGKSGIRKLVLSNNKALISDDTQMTLFTANGLLNATTEQRLNGHELNYIEHIKTAYFDWWVTQTYYANNNSGWAETWLMNIPELYNSRSPGATCITAFEDGYNGSIEKPINNSKGCGGVMRVAPIGLYFDSSNSNYTMEEIDMIGAKVAALTHGHPLGYMSAAMMVHIINKCIYSDMHLKEIVTEALVKINELFYDSEYLTEFNAIINKAIELSESKIPNYDAIKQIGQGWVAEEALAIAIYSSLKYSSDFEEAVICAVNHDGDSDSTGAITGNILGAYVGLNNIFRDLWDNLELKEVIIEIADDLYNDCLVSRYSSTKDKIWELKYVDKTYSI